MYTDFYFEVKPYADIKSWLSLIFPFISTRLASMCRWRMPLLESRCRAAMYCEPLRLVCFEEARWGFSERSMESNIRMNLFAPYLRQHCSFSPKWHRSDVFLSVKWLKSAITEICWYSICKTVKLKPFVFALFSQNENQRFTDIRKSLISNVDQPGLEPGTSRLWVCCSNRLSYKSDIWESRHFLSVWLVSLSLVVLPGFEPRLREPKTLVLPLHHSTIL